MDVAFQAMVQSLWVWMTLDGLLPLTERSKSLSVVVILSSVREEKRPEKTVSRLTAIPDRTCFHSDLGNRSRDPADCRDQRVCLRSAV